MNPFFAMKQPFFFFVPEIPHPLIFIHNRSHQDVNMSDLLSDFKWISTGYCRIALLIKSLSVIIIKHNGMGWNPIWHPRWLPKLENIKILQTWLYPNNDGRRIFSGSMRPALWVFILKMNILFIPGRFVAFHFVTKYKRNVRQFGPWTIRTLINSDLIRTSAMVDSDFGRFGS